jgi:hypothetical protein
MQRNRNQQALKHNWMSAFRGKSEIAAMSPQRHRTTGRVFNLMILSNTHRHPAVNFSARALTFVLHWFSN